MNHWIVLGLVAVGIYFYLKSRSPAVATGSEVSGRLGGTGQFAFDIVGESHYQDALEKICGGRSEDGAEEQVEATLYLEDENKFDSKAVRVDIQGKTVGYLSRDDARSYRRQLASAGHPKLIGRCDALIVGGWKRGSRDKGHFGAKLDLPVA